MRSASPPFFRLRSLFPILGCALFWACRSPENALRFSDALASDALARSEYPGVPADAAGRDHAGSGPARPGRPARSAAASRFQYAGPLSEGLAPVQIDSRWGYADARGELVIPAVYDWAGPFREGRAAVAAAGEYRFIDAAGDTVGTLAFSDARALSGGRAAVRFGDAGEGAWGFIDRGGRLAIPPVFADVPRGFSGGYAVVTVGSEGGRSFGFIDTSGGFAMDSLFDAAGDFSAGLAPVARGRMSGGRFRGAWSYVDTAGTRAFPGEWAWAGSFEGDRALVRGFDGEFAFIDRHGAPAGRVPGGLLPAETRNGGIVTYTLRRTGTAGRWARRASAPPPSAQNP